MSDKPLFRVPENYSNKPPGRKIVPGVKRGATHGARRHTYGRPAGEIPRDVLLTLGDENVSSMAVAPEDRKRDIINAKRNRIVIANLISSKLGRKLTQGEISEINTVIRTLNYQVLASARIADINEKVAHVVYNHINNYTCRDDLSESELKYRMYLKSQQDYEQTQQQISNLTKISNITSSCCEEFYEQSSLHINSRNADVDDFPTRKWKFTVTSTGGSDGVGSVLTTNIPTNVRAMSITEFDIPYVISLDNTQADRVGLVIDQFRGAAFRTSSLGVPYHFLFSTKVMGNRIRLTPLIEKFTFARVLNSFTDLDLVFTDTEREIDLPRDRENTGSFAINAGPPVTFQVTTGNAHNLASGDTVFFTNFASVVGSETPQEQFLNDLRGHKISVIDDFNFTVNVDMTGNPVVFVAGWSIYYGSKQWRFPLRVQHIRPDGQQIIQSEEA